MAQLQHCPRVKEETRTIFDLCFLTHLTGPAMEFVGGVYVRPNCREHGACPPLQRNRATTFFGAPKFKDSMSEETFAVALHTRIVALRDSSDRVIDLFDYGGVLQIKQAARYVRLFSRLHHASVTLLAATVDETGASIASERHETPQHQIERMLLGWRFDPCLREMYTQILKLGSVSESLAMPFAIALMRHAYHDAKPEMQPCAVLPTGVPIAIRQACTTAPPCTPVDARVGLPSALQTRVETLTTKVRQSFSPERVLRPELRAYGMVPRWSMQLRAIVKDLIATRAGGAAYDTVVRAWGGLVVERRLAALLLHVSPDAAPMLAAIWTTLVDDFTVASNAERVTPPEVRVRLDVLALLSSQFRGDQEAMAAFEQVLRLRIPHVRNLEEALAERAMRWARLFRWAHLIPAAQPSTTVVKSLYGADELELDSIGVRMVSVEFGGSAQTLAVSAARAEAQLPFVAPGYLWKLHEPRDVQQAAKIGGALETGTISQVRWRFPDGRMFQVQMLTARPVMAAIRRQRLYVTCDAPSREWCERFLPRGRQGRMQSLAHVLGAVTLTTWEKREWASPALEAILSRTPQLDRIVHALHYDEPLPDLDDLLAVDGDLLRYIRLVGARVVLLRADLQPRSVTLRHLHSLQPKEDVNVQAMHFESVGSNPILVPFGRALFREALDGTFSETNTPLVALSWGREFKLPRQHVKSSSVTLDDIRTHIGVL
jgi:hypothetical protein